MKTICTTLLLTAALFAQQKDTVIVTGTADSVPLEESERNVSVEQVRGDALLTTNTVIDFLNRDSSVDLRQRGGNNIQTDVSIRGASFGQTLVLLNGMHMNDAQSGHHNMDLPTPLEATEKIEVLKGAGSTLYGSDAIGGVINVITSTPKVSEFRLRTSVGNFGVNQQRFSIGSVGKRWSEQLSFSRDFSTGFIPNRDYRNLSMSSSTSGTTELGTTSILLAHVDKPFGAEQFYGNFNSWERTRTWFGSLQQTIHRHTQFGIAYRRHTDLFVLYRDRPQVFTNRHKSDSFQANVRRTREISSNGKLHYGAEVFHDGVESNNLGVHSRTRGSAFAVLDVRVLKRFSFTAGLREELYGSFNSQWSPSIGAGYWASSQLKFRASISRAFRLPSFTDLYYRDPANLGSPNLRPEHATSFEAGADWTPNTSIRSEVTVFHRRDRDGIDYVRATVNDIWRATNFQKLQFTGIEASTKVRIPGNQDMTLSYTGLRGAQDQLGALLSKYAFNYPNHIATASWQSVTKNGWVTRVRLSGVKRYGRDPYALMDFYVTRTTGSFHPYLQLTNMTKAKYQEIAGVAMPGRGVVVGFEVAMLARRR